MLHDLFDLFGSVPPGGAVALLAIGFMLGTAFHEYTIWLIGAMRNLVRWLA